MSRPTVLVATTNPAMAYALRRSLKDKCKSLGLKLEVCTDGDEKKVGGEEVNIYDSAEALFDALEKRDPMELADTLVVLDVGVHLAESFEPETKDGSWHVTDNRAGVAVELLLRFPQVFPVFLSPAVPITGSDIPTIPSCFKHKLQTGNKVDKCETGCWKGFGSLQEDLSVKNRRRKTKDTKFEPVPLDIHHLYALAVPLHFVSPLDQGAGLQSTLDRFAHGMRCWFDPTGLRTLVKNRFLGTLFGDKFDWEATWTSDPKKPKLREVLLERLGKMAVTVDEEREFAVLSAYASWKYGRRAWIVTTYREFETGLWRNGSDSVEDAGDVIVLRDVDIRFPDIPKESGIREQLKNIGSPKWGEFSTNWYVRAISGDVNVIEQLNVSKNHPDYSKCIRLGQFEIFSESQGQKDKQKFDYTGFSKPVGSLYELKSVLGKQAEDAGQTLQSRIGVADDSKGGGGHGAPYSNLAMAEALLRYSSACKDGPSAHLIGALLAMESCELLLGMSKTTALEALLAVHKHEVMAEVSFPGVSHTVDIEERKKDVEATLDSLYKDNASVGEPKNFKQKKDSERVKKIYLSQFWSELRIKYRDGEQFDAAEKSNIQSLFNSHDWLKMWMLHPATSIIWWLRYALGFSFIFALGYGWLSTKVSFQVCWPECLINFLDIWWQVVMAMLQVQLGDNDQIVTASKSGSEFGLHIVELLHMGVSYLLLGLLISMLYRKITRS